MLLDGFENLLVDQRFVTERAQIAHDVENRRLRRAVRQRRHRRVHDTNALLDDFQHVERREAIVAVRVEFHRNVPGVVENNARKRSGALRREHAADVLITQAIGLQGRRFARLARVIFVRMARRDRVNDVDHRFHAEAFQLGDFFAEHAVIVPGIGKPSHPNAVVHDPFDDEARNAARRQSETAVHPSMIA